MSLRRAQSLAAASLTLMAGVSLAHQAAGPACTGNARQQPDIVRARTTLERSPSALATRLNLASLLYKTECYDDAVHVLEDGEKYNPHNPYLQYYLERAHNMQKGEQYLESLDKAEGAVRVPRNKLRCIRLDDLGACDAVLKEQPNNLEILLAKADALVKKNRIGDALAVYSLAAELAPNNKSIQAKLQTLHSQRHAFLKDCMEGTGETALHACKEILVKGAPNEFDITHRIATLQQSMKQPLLALDSYLAANSLRPGNKEIALAILALLDSTKRKDAVALAARASALSALGRPGEAIAPLHVQPRVVAANVAKEAVAEAVPEPRSFSNAAPASRSN